MTVVFFLTNHNLMTADWNLRGCQLEHFRLPVCFC